MTDERAREIVEPLYLLWEKGSITAEVLAMAILRNVRDAEAALPEGLNVEQAKIRRLLAEDESTGAPCHMCRTKPIHPALGQEAM